MAKKKSSGSWSANYLNHGIRLIVAVIVILVALEVYRYLLSDIITGRSHFLAYIVLWLFTAYLVLPRINRVLTRLYLPSYFIGRARTGDGLLGDPINLAINGHEEQLIKAMIAAGWAQADRLTLYSALKISWSSIVGRNYASAPVSSLYLFGERQKLAFEKDLHGNPRRRHHIRLWRTPEDWWLPGGHRADWLAAATFDKNIGLSLFTGQITHKIDADIDQERDFVIRTLREAGVARHVHIVKHFVSGFHGRNGGGDKIETDGALPFIQVD